MSQHVAETIGIDLSTTSFKLGVRGADGSEDFASIDVAGGTRWCGQPAFFLEHVPEMFLAALAELNAKGWSFDRPGDLSFSVRQHDMCVMSAGAGFLIPTLSWECHEAKEQVARLQEQAAESTVGKIEPRFILPKLLWALEQSQGLDKLVRHVAATGDVLAWKLTGQFRLSASDALSNALLDQQNKQLAAGVMEKAGVSPNWFPPVIGSGQFIGLVSPSPSGVDTWSAVRETLADWSVYAGLGDNHAGAVGCGLADDRTIVISAGSSGTICRQTSPASKLAGKAACFEYYDQRLLLMMLARCSLWYEDFLEENGWREQHEENNNAAMNCGIGSIVRIENEEYPQGFAAFDTGVKVASVQFSIALEMLLLVKDMLVEVQGEAQPIRRFALTGGLSQAPLFRGVLQEGLKILAPDVPVEVSARSGGLAFQTATFGALINASLKGDISRLAEAAEKHCAPKPCDSLPDQKSRDVADLLRKHLQ